MKKSTNSFTKHSVELRLKTAKKANKKKRASGEYKRITILVKPDIYDEIRAFKAETEQSYSAMLQDYIVLKNGATDNE